jgi:SAM-dependent methyltransferase
MLRKDLHNENRLAWNEATLAHNSHKRDQADFFRQGGQTLFPEEKQLLGDISGLSLVHLQCNAGQDTLSLAQMGAQVTGVDISDTAIDFAKELAKDSGIPATFIRDDVYNWLADVSTKPPVFDVVFSSYGAIAWLSDIRLWAKGVEGVLRPDGRLVLLEFHPVAMIFDEDWTLRYPYFAGGSAYTWQDGIGDYVADAGKNLAPSGYLEGVVNFRNPCPAHEFQWTIAEIVSALLDAGMTLVQFNEYPHMNGAKLMQHMQEQPGGRMYPPEELPSLPLMFGLVAQKPE